MTPLGDANQREVFAFLQDPRVYGRSEPVLRIDTHGAAVFLAGPNVYKVKRAVRFPFMDFSTLEKRRVACEAEIAVNRDNAPDLYLGVVPIVRRDGVLRLGGEGEVLEWAVHLRRFDENATLDRLAARGPLGLELINKLADAVLASHRRASLRDGRLTTSCLRRALKETIDELELGRDVFPTDQVGAIGAILLSAFDQVEPVLLDRGARGLARRCHGDLHLGNLVLIDNAPVLFDAIEFDDAIATSDILYDLAFVVMDLWKRRLRIDANRLLNRYVLSGNDEWRQIEGLAAMPLFLSLRAAIRAKVVAELFRMDQKKTHLRDEARAYLEAAIEFLRPFPPRLIAIGGLSGTGKSTLAAELAPALGQAPGALHLRSDVERKRLFAVDEKSRLATEAYRADVSASVYQRLRQHAEQGLRAGQTIVMDATYQQPEEREALAALATKTGVALLGLWLEAPTETLMRRVAGRRGDASDANAAVVAAQARETIGAVAWRRLDASASPDGLRAAALAVIGTQGSGSPA